MATKISPPFDAYDGNEPYVFVSYSHSDSAVVFEEIKRLHGVGCRIWYDDGIVATSEWSSVIEKKLEGCSLFLVYITGRSRESENVKDEINYAIKENKTFLYVCLEDIKLPDGMALRMSRLQGLLKFQLDEDTYFRKLLKAIPDRFIDQEDKLASRATVSPGSGHVKSRVEVGITWIQVEGFRKPFHIASTQVTFDQYDLFCDATGYRKPHAKFSRGKMPVTDVNVADAAAFCIWLTRETGTTIRLPEEAEWEYAARGGNKSNKHIYSGSDIIDEVAWYQGNSGRQSHPVGQKKPNELGIYDMSGNVAEWCGTSGVLRGGSFYDSASECRVTGCLDINPASRDSSNGFRCVRE